MMLKVNSEYLDFNADIDIERKVKLFEDIETNDGDLSFSFQLDLTSRNLAIIGAVLPDASSKLVYSKIPCGVYSNEGLLINSGSLRIERIPPGNRYAECSFLGGNSNWFGLLSGPLSDIDFSDLDVEQTYANIIGSASSTEGLTWPIVDNGVLVSRGYSQIVLEDFVPGLYVHTVIKRIFQKHSIKIQGDLLKDPNYYRMTTHQNVKSQSDIDAGSTFAQNTGGTSRPTELVPVKVFFDDQSNFPYFDGSNDFFKADSTYGPVPYQMKIRIQVSLLPAIIDSSYNNRIYLYINGAFTFVDVGLDSGAGGLYNSSVAGNISPTTLDRTFILDAGDTLEVYSEWQQSSGSTVNDLLPGGTVKITPLYIYNVFGNALVPKWTQQEYVSNIFRILNVITAYEPISKTLTLNLLDKLPTKEPIDISEYIQDIEVDYQEFISNYGKRNLLSYNEVTFDDLRNYNVRNFFKYGQGVIESNNEFLKDSEDIVESDFSNPLGYINSVFGGMSMERLDIVRLEQSDQMDFTGVTDNAGAAVFAVPENKYLPGDLIRISDSTNPYYNGDWVVDSRGAGTLSLFGVAFDSNATGSMAKLTHVYNESDDVYLLFNIPDYSIPDMSSSLGFFFGIALVNSHAVGYFNLLNTGRQINTDFKQSLSFGEIQSEFFYQRTLVDTYWNVFSRMVNDPAMIKGNGYLPWVVHDRIDFLRPIRIKTLETDNLYYLNRETGYKASYTPCELELIKLP